MNKKNSNVLNLKSLIKSNKKISSIYSIFKGSLKPLYKKRIIVAVSGGPDSLCLAALAKVLQSEKKMKVDCGRFDRPLSKRRIAGPWRVSSQSLTAKTKKDCRVARNLLRERIVPSKDRFRR